MEEARSTDVPLCRMEEAVKNFSKRHRELIELVGGRLLSYPEAAEVLHLSTRTVEDYATQIRDASGLKMRPRDALIRIAIDRNKTEVVASTP